MRKSKFSEAQIATMLKEAALDTQHSQIEGLPWSPTR